EAYMRGIHPMSDAIKKAASVLLAACCCLLSVSPLLWADITNTASVSFMAGGFSHTNLSNTVVVAVPVSLPAPTLNLPSVLPVNADITAGYPPGYSVSTVWSFTQTATLASPPGSVGSAVVGAVTNYA